jgi:hypothetical protein
MGQGNEIQERGDTNYFGKKILGYTFKKGRGDILRVPVFEDETRPTGNTLQLEQDEDMSEILKSESFFDEFNFNLDHTPEDYYRYAETDGMEMKRINMYGDKSAFFPERYQKRNKELKEWF